MTLNSQFSKLSLSERYTYITESGKYIGLRSYYNHAVKLYLIEETFYEVCHFIPDNYLVKVEPLDDLKKLDLYIIYMTKLDERPDTINIADSFLIDL